MSDPAGPQLPTRAGAHRPRRSPLRDVVPTLAVLVAVVAIGLGAWALTRSTASTIQSSGSDDGVSASQAPVPTGPTSSPTGGTGSPSATATGSTPTSATSTTSGTVDRSVRITVLNATRTTGLAASVARTLRSSGWTVPTTDNYRDGEPPTTVFYGSADERATAQAVAEDVGGEPEVEQSDEFGSEGITVVLGSDYAG